jgi:hypothetical protein
MIGNELPWGGSTERLRQGKPQYGLEEYTQMKLVSMDLTE